MRRHPELLRLCCDQFCPLMLGTAHREGRLVVRHGDEHPANDVESGMVPPLLLHRLRQGKGDAADIVSVEHGYCFRSLGQLEAITVGAGPAADATSVLTP